MNYSFPPVRLYWRDDGRRVPCGESIVVHEGEALQPTESVGTKHVGSGGHNGFEWNGWLTCGESDPRM